MDGPAQIDIRLNEQKPKSTKKRKVAQADTQPGKRSLNLSLPMEDYRRLALHALHFDISISDLVCKLAREHLREVHLSRTATAGRPEAE